MRKHSGMKPQDVAILLKIVALGDDQWKQLDLAKSLFLSTFEISNALNRCVFARLIDESRTNVFKKSVVEFLVHGFKYVYPVRPGGVIKGVPTAHSAPPLSQMISSSTEAYVWPDVEGTSSGQAIEPLYAGAPKAAKQDAKLYELLSLVDALRVGKARELKLAEEELRKRIEAE